MISPWGKQQWVFAGSDGGRRLRFKRLPNEPQSQQRRDFIALW